jgi:hypothetical protein
LFFYIGHIVYYFNQKKITVDVNKVQVRNLYFHITVIGGSCIIYPKFYATLLNIENTNNSNNYLFMKNNHLLNGLYSIGIFLFLLFATTNCSKYESAANDKNNTESRLKATNYAEVTLSGSTWTGKVDGVTKYTGTDLFAACNTCITAMTAGTIKLKNSGSSGASGGVIKSINLKSDIIFDGGGCTINANTTDHLIVPIMADRKSNITIKNVKITGAPRYAIWLKGCNGITVSGLTMTMTDGWLGLRIDNSTGSTTNANVGDITVSGGSMGVETYGLDGFTAGTVTATNMTECGLLFNASKNCTVGTVNATNCNYGGGYAGFRVANSNGPNVKVTNVYSKSCGRGFFSVTSSNGTTIGYLDAQNCSGQGALIENAQNTVINKGYIYNNGSDGIRFSSTLSYGCKYNLVQYINTNDGIKETSPCNYNTVKYCKLNGSGLTLSGVNSVSSGNTL